jgi:hypothetical protein
MKKRFFASVLLLALVASSALAACPGTSSTSGCRGCVTTLWTKSYRYTTSKYWNVSSSGKCVSTTVTNSGSCGSC